MFIKTQDRSNNIYIIFTTLFSVILILSNMIGVKIFKAPFFADLPLTSGILTYPITFIITDIVSEIWGSKRAKFMIYVAFGMNIVMLLFVKLILALPSHPFWVAANNPFGYESLHQYETAFSCVFSINDKILMGSMLAFLTAQLLDVKIFSKIKEMTQGKKLWLRNNVSTCASQLVDTIIVSMFVLIWGLKLNFTSALLIMGSEYLYKVIFALCDTPFVYFGTYLTKKTIGIYEFKKAA